MPEPPKKKPRGPVDWTQRRPVRGVKEPVKAKPPKLMFLKDQQTIDLVKKRLAGLNPKTKEWAVRVVNYFKDNPERVREFSKQLRHSHSKVIVGILPIIGNKKLDPGDFK